MSKKEKENPYLSNVIERSRKACGLINILTMAEFKGEEVLKNFVLWTLINPAKDHKSATAIHRVHSNWNHTDPMQQDVLLRGILICLVDKIGMRKIEETLTAIRLGVNLDDEEDNQN